MLDIPIGAGSERAFPGRVVSFLVEDAGIRQFLDVGTGLPRRTTPTRSLTTCRTSCLTLGNENRYHRHAGCRARRRRWRMCCWWRAGSARWPACCPGRYWRPGTGSPS
ncbi:SAM-dependent methyltransferase [Micromonospora sp. LOL_023]|uniref:SAM-dependent methyltransferase n=1 Tax=Micromonospora sp. LOL_023 TaxID=3345418 RepID=UPI003A883211